MADKKYFDEAGLLLHPKHSLELSFFQHFAVNALQHIGFRLAKIQAALEEANHLAYRANLIAGERNLLAAQANDIADAPRKANLKALRKSAKKLQQQKPTEQAS